ncbi:efflux RND transporter periplasmic adaptor subunit [Mucisphaera calidilacus]|uniref:Uncharacterized protein n=1 Tax=Mucisphaera calidilacus TaxID=2527982 RepID=A0A518C142_9BACT|nr:efflux RND transporter periplasmic adaptor subunit [Mucisphaera calidilacus]QDU72945.1 hypothetical protein Pan265_28210 [Mucisphaera calidilacus]
MVNPYKPRARAAGGGGGGQRENPLPPARADLLISPQLYHGQSVYVVKDPVGLTYFRLRPAEYYVYRQLDGHKTASEIERLAAERFPETELSAEEIQAFAMQLLGAGLLLPTDKDSAKRIRGIRDTRRKKMRAAKLRSFLFIKIPLFDPEAFLVWLYRYVGLFMTRPMMIFAVLWMTLSAAVALANLQGVSQLAFPVLSWTNALLFTAVFLTIKVIHEIGHGIAAHHHGLEVHETGVMLMVFLPLFYVDTSDAWTLPDKRDRLWITAGGVFIEMLFASVAVWVWIATEPGWVNQLAFNTMLSASVTSILFNANPLLRYDGYYFLMDWVEVPNLQTKAIKYLGQRFDLWALRVEPTEPEPDEAERMPRFFMGYALAAGAYRTMVLISITLIAWHLLDGVGLQAVGALLGMFALTTMILMPLYKGLKHVWSIQTQSGVRLAWSAVVAGLALLIAGTVWFFPVTETVLHPGVVLAERHQPIYARVDGELAEVYVETGSFAEAGEPIVRLSNRRLEDRVAELRVELSILEVEAALFRQRGELTDATAAEIKKDQIREQIALGESQIEKLIIRATMAGRVMAGTRLQGMLGVRVSRGQALGMLVSSEAPRVALVVPQDDAALVQPGHTARMRLWSMPWEEITGRVAAVERGVMATVPHRALNTAHGGEVDTNPSDPYKGEPSRPSVLAWIELDAADETSRWWVDGMTGRARVEVGRTRFGPQQWRRVRQALTLDWWI